MSAEDKELEYRAEEEGLNSNSVDSGLAEDEQSQPEEVLTEIPEEQRLRDALGLKDIAFKHLEEHNQALQKKLTDLTILIYQVLEQDEADFFDDNVRTIERQNIRRMLKAKFPLTPEMVEIVNKSKEQQQQNSIS